MWLRKLFLVFLLALLLLSLSFGQSVQDKIISSLSDYQIRLQQVIVFQNESNKTILTLSSQIQDYQKQINNYKQQLIDSQNQSEIEIQNIKDSLKKSEIDLEISRLLLERSRKDLLALQDQYKILSMELNKLRVSLNLSKSIKWIGIGIATGEAIYIIFSHIK